MHPVDALLGLNPDEVLSTTRAVRRRLDFGRAVPREMVARCIELALQAPNGSNRNQWRFIAVDDRDTVARMAGIDDAALADYVRSLGHRVGANYAGADVPGYASLIVSVMFFSGVQLISLGVIGGYIGRIFAEVKRRPLYIIAEESGPQSEPKRQRRA